VRYLRDLGFRSSNAAVSRYDVSFVKGAGMKRRDFMAMLGGAVIAWPLAARGQQETRGHHIPVVGFVGLASTAVDEQSILPFRRGLSELGYVEGRTIILERRNAEGNVERGHALLMELAALPVDVFLSPGPAVSRALVRLTKIPVVAISLPATESEPNLFASLARPGGTLTGFSAFGEEMSAKRIEMLKELMPGLKTIGVMHNATDPMFSAWGEQTMADARKAGLEPVRFGLTSASPATLVAHFRKLGEIGGTAMIVIRDFLTAALMAEIGKAGLDTRIAVVGEYAEVVRNDGLFSYGADQGDQFRRAAGYVDRILKGEKAADLPIQLPTKFELGVNLKTARILGLTLPPTILVRADEVIE
jgi:putative tryptophan/tyrosine transport system substrate-binding protein